MSNNLFPRDNSGLLYSGNAANLSISGTSIQDYKSYVDTYLNLKQNTITASNPINLSAANTLTLKIDSSTLAIDATTGNLKVVGGGTGSSQWSTDANSNISFNNLVGIGQASQQKGVLELYSTNQLLPRLLLNGREYNSTNTSSDGIALLCGVNLTGNRQFWIGDSAKLVKSSTNPILRIAGTRIDTMATDGSTTLQMTVGNSGGIVLDGNTSIGSTDTSTYKLSVTGTSYFNHGASTTASATFTSSGADATISLKNTSTSGREYWLGSAETGAGAGVGNFYIHDNSSGGGTRMIINSSGYCGIGLTNPISKFTIKSTYDNVDSGLCLDASDAAGINNSYNLKLYSYVVGASMVGYKMQIVNISSTLDIMTFRHDGNIGIKNGNPGNLLSVSGSGNAGLFLNDISNNSIYLGFQNTIQGSRGYIGLDGNGYGAISAGAMMLSTWINHPVIFAMNAVERMRIDTNGHLIMAANSDIQMNASSSTSLNTVEQRVINNITHLAGCHAGDLLISNYWGVAININSGGLGNNGAASKAKIPGTSSFTINTRASGAAISAGFNRTLFSIRNNGDIYTYGPFVNNTQFGVIVNDRGSYDHSTAQITLTNQSATSTTVLNDPQQIIHLCRQGTGGQAYGARATFKLCRWENNGVNSRTKLDLNMAHGSYDDVNIMSFRSDGNVFVNGTLNVTSGILVSSSNNASYGSIKLNTNNTVNPGYLEFFKPGNVRVGYVEYQDGVDINYLVLETENGYSGYKVTNNLIVSGNTTLNGNLSVGGSINLKNINCQTLNASSAIGCSGHINCHNEIILYSSYFTGVWYISRINYNGHEDSLVFNHVDSNRSINSFWYLDGNQQTTTDDLSDTRIKFDVKNIESPIQKLMNIEPKEYYWMDDKDKKQTFGIIAQEVQTHFPEMVTIDPDYIANVLSNASINEKIITCEKILMDY